jgi:cytochrome c-type biogenesis protein CcmH/NrfG
VFGGNGRVMATDKAMPSDVSAQRTLFDRFADRASTVVSRAPFFAFCVLLVIVWLPSYFAFGNIDTWQLIINTITTIVTFLLVALLQNSQRRSEQAMNQKLDALADGLADLMDRDAHRPGGQRLQRDQRDLREAVGIEDPHRR